MNSEKAEFAHLTHNLLKIEIRELLCEYIVLAHCKNFQDPSSPYYLV